MMRQRRTVDEKTNKRDAEYSNDKHHAKTKSPETKKTKKVQSIVTTAPAIFILISVFWIHSSIVVTSNNTWVAVPFIGNCRWDIAAMFLTAQVTFMYMTWTRSSWWIPVAVVIFLSFGLPHLPENYRPMTYMRPLAAIYEQFVSEGEGVSVHSTGFSHKDAAALVDMAIKYKDRWTHIDAGQALGYFSFGTNINTDHRMSGRVKGYTLKYGVDPTNEVLKYESSFRLFYQDDMADVQSILHEHLAPKLRQVFANTLGIDHEQVVFGNEIGGGYEKSRLGMPAIMLIFPNVVWHWVQNPHLDHTLENRIPQNMVPCKKAHKVTTFLIPLTAPRGSCLRDWKRGKDGNVIMNEAKYEIGKVYTFDASNTLHAIGPLPYFEWKRSSYRITVQGFGVQCDDLKWYIYN